MKRIFITVIVICMIPIASIAWSRTVHIELNSKYIEDLESFDVDLDGIDELIVLTNHDGSTQIGQLLVYKWNGTQFDLFWESSEIKDYPYGMQIGDVDLDGLEDILLSCGGLRLFLNNGHGFSDKGNIVPQTADDIFICSDLDGDNYIDLALGSPGAGTTKVKLYQQIPFYQEFTYVSDLPTTPGNNMVKAINVNDDNNIDILTAESYSGDVYAFRNDGREDSEFALSFDGLNDYVEIPDTTDFNFNQPLTVSGWLFLNDNVNGGIVGQWGYGGLGGDAFMLALDNSHLRATLPKPGLYHLYSNSEMKTNQWIHVAMVYDRSVLKLYIDGKLDASGDISVNSVDSSQTVKIGLEDIMFNQKHYLNGIVDEVQIWNVARTQEEIQDNMHKPLLGDETGLVGYWRFDEGEGQITYDSSRNGNNGQLGSTPEIDHSDPNWVVSDTPDDRPTISFEFTKIFTYQFNTRIFSVESADFDGDNFEDFIVAEAWANIHFFKNNFGESFQINFAGSNIGSVFHTLAYDINQDSQIDLIAAAFDGNVYLYENLGGFNFNEILCKVSTSGNYGLSVGDFDGDRIPDMAFGKDPVVIVFNAPNSFDTIKPNVSFTSPSSGAYLKSIVTLTANANGQNGIAKVEFFYDAIKIGEDTTEPYSVNWNTETVNDGRFFLTAKAWDVAGNSAVSDSVNITVDNTPPTSIITNPLANQSIAGIYDIEGTADDANFKQYTLEYGMGIEPTEWYVIVNSNTEVREEILESWDTTAVSNGAYTIRLVTEDEAGNVLSFSVIVNVKNVIAISLTSPLSETYLQGTVTLTTEITSTSEVATVEFFYDATKIGEDTTEPYSVDWNTITLADGSYSLTAKVWNVAGNSATSSSVNVIVDNKLPTSIITKPLDNEPIAGIYDIEGTAYDANFKQYTLEYGIGASPTTWLDVGVNPRMIGITSGILGSWDTTTATNGKYTIRLVVEDEVSNILPFRVIVNVENPVKPSVLTFHDDFSSAEIRDDYWEIHEWNAGKIEVVNIGDDFGNVVRIYDLQEESGIALRFPPTDTGINISRGNTVVQGWLRSDGTECGFYFTDRIISEGENLWQHQPAFQFFINEQGTFTASTNGSPFFIGGFGHPIEWEEWYHYRAVFTPTDDPQEFLYLVYVNDELIKEAQLNVGEINTKNVFVYFEAHRNPGSGVGAWLDALKINIPCEVFGDQDPPDGSITINNGDEYTNSTNVTLKLEAWYYGESASGVAIAHIYGNVKTYLTPPWPSGEEIFEVDCELSEEDGQKRVEAIFKDEGCNESDLVFDTIILDTTHPNVSLTSPSSEVYLKGAAALSADANDINDIDKVEFFYDTSKIGEDTTEPYSLLWDTKAVDGGSYSLTAKAVDVTGNSTISDAVTVTVDNTPPTIAITEPTSGASLRDIVTIAADANDNNGIARVQFFYDTTLIGEDTTEPYSLLWDTKAVDGGSYSLTAKAVDVTGNSTISDAVTVTVDNTPPTIAITEPTSGASLRDIVTIAADANDNNGIARVQFFYDTTLIGEDTTEPYSLLWDTKTVDDGSYSLTVKAWDVAGNITISDSVNVIVDNEPPIVKSAVFDKKKVRNGETVLLTVITETGATVTVDFSVLDTTKTLVSLVESTETPGTFTTNIIISKENKAENGDKTVTIIASDVADNDTKSEVMIKLYPSWDINKDGIVNILDLIGIQFGENDSTKTTDWDINGDGVVDISDLVLVGIRFGEN